MINIKLSPPIENFSWQKNISQLFGVNFNVYNSKFNIPGHNGLDIVVRNDKYGYGTKILAAHDAVVTRVFTDFPTKTQGTGVYLQQKIGDTIVETIYWHLADILVKAGDEVKAGQVIGLMGNTGFVFPKPSQEFPYYGTHLHFAVRIYKNNILQSTQYGGFVDPTPFLFNEGDKLSIHFLYNRFLFAQDDDVAWVQTCLKIEFPDLTFEPTGYYGNLTRKALVRLQEKYEIIPAWGYLYPKTRQFLNRKYSYPTLRNSGVALLK